MVFDIKNDLVLRPGLVLPSEQQIKIMIIISLKLSIETNFKNHFLKSKGSFCKFYKSIFIIFINCKDF